MNHDEKAHDPHQVDPKAPDNVHQSHAAGTKQPHKASSGDKQTPVPEGEKGDPTVEPWKQINSEKVMTTKEELPAPKKR
jgi:hypothetical protein